MSLLNTLQGLKKDGFDPQKDKIGGGGSLPEGRYPVKLESSSVVITSTGRTQIQLKLEVISGEHKGKRETIFLGFDEDLPDFVVENNGKYLMKIAAFTGVEFMESDLQYEENTAEKMKEGIGRQFIMKLDIRENKKNPDFPYRNYDFQALDDDPLADQKTSDFPEKDIPF